MSHYSLKPIEISLRPSWMLAAWLIGLHTLALFLVLVLPLPWPVSWLWSWFLRLLLALALVASLGYHLADQVLRRLSHSVVALKLATDGTFSICQTSGWVSAAVLGSSFVSPGLTILNLRLETRRFPVHVVLMPDALEAEVFRRLRVWLKWGVKALPD